MGTGAEVGEQGAEEEAHSRSGQGGAELDGRGFYWEEAQGVIHGEIEVLGVGLHTGQKILYPSKNRLRALQGQTWVVSQRREFEGKVVVVGGHDAKAIFCCQMDRKT